MATIDDIDELGDIEIYPSVTRPINDEELVTLAEKLKLPQLLTGAFPIAGKAIVISGDNASNVIRWMREAGRQPMFERHLQGLAQSNDGTPLLTTWMSVEEARRFFDAEKVCPELTMMPQLLEQWLSYGADEIYIEVPRYC